MKNSLIIVNVISENKTKEIRLRRNVLMRPSFSAACDTGESSVNRNHTLAECLSRHILVRQQNNNKKNYCVLMYTNCFWIDMYILMYTYYVTLYMYMHSIRTRFDIINYLHGWNRNISRWYFLLFEDLKKLCPILYTFERWFYSFFSICFCLNTLPDEREIYLLSRETETERCDFFFFCFLLRKDHVGITRERELTEKDCHEFRILDDLL